MISVEFTYGGDKPIGYADPKWNRFKIDEQGNLVLYTVKEAEGKGKDVEVGGKKIFAPGCWATVETDS